MGNAVNQSTEFDFGTEWAVIEKRVVYSDVEHSIRQIQGKSIKSPEDDQALEDLCLKLTRIVNQKAALEDQINPRLSTDTLRHNNSKGDKKKSKSLKFNPKKMVNKGLSSVAKKIGN